MKLSKISLAWVRISILCITVMAAVILVSRQPGVEKLLKKIMTPVLTASEQKWSLEQDKTYTLCGHSEMLKNDYKSLKDLQTVISGHQGRLVNQGRPGNQGYLGNQGFRLKRISGHLHVYAIDVMDYCVNCRNYQFLGVVEQSVAVIRGTPEKPGPIQEKTALKIEDLPQLELEDLQKGIPFKNGNEKLQLIEGLKGLSAN